MPEMFESTTEFVFDICFPSGHLKFWYTLCLLTDSIKCGLNKSLRSPYPYCWVYVSSELMFSCLCAYAYI